MNRNITHLLLTSMLAALVLTGCRKPNQTAEDQKPPEEPAVTQEAREWPIFRGDTSLDGQLPDPLSLPLSLAWSHKTGGPILSSAVIAGGVVYVGSDDGKLYALDLEKGEPAWAFDAGAPIEAPPLVVGSQVIVGDLDGKVHSVNLKTGEADWDFTTDDQITGSANVFVSDGATNLLIGSHDFFLYSLDAATGRSNWVFESGSFINGTPAMSDGQVVFGGCDAVLHVLSAATGEKLEEVDAGAYVAGSVALVNGQAYFGHMEGEFMCIDVGQSNVVWQYRDRNFPYYSSPAVADNRVVFGGRDKRVHCVNRADGVGVWTFATRGAVDSSPVICGDQVVVGSNDGRLYIVALEDGAELWNYEIGQALTASPAVARGRVVIGSEDGTIYCFGPEPPAR